MSWQIATFVAAIVGPVVAVVTVSFFQGRLKEKVDGHGAQLRDLWDIKAAERLARLEGWKDGMDATLRMLEKKKGGMA